MMCRQWFESISEPTKMLTKGFQPSDEQLIYGLEFFLFIISISFLFYVPLVAIRDEQFGNRLKVAARILLTLTRLLVLWLFLHLVFNWLGGKANFAGTLLAYIYSGAPYLPIMSFFSMIMIAGLPADLRVQALNPLTATKALQDAQSRYDTHHGIIAIGSLLSLLATLAATIITLKSMAYIHDLSTLRIIQALFLSSFLGIPFFFIFVQLESLFDTEK